jgi:tetratricopeptide (TPR) repeat protein
VILLLNRIEQELAQSNDPLRQAELHAERAGYLARVGDFAAAKEILAWLRREYGDGRQARISIWIMLVEGLVLYFEKLSASARDRIYRAYTISCSFGLEDLAALTSVWLAHLNFEHSAYQQMAECLSRTLKANDLRQIAVQARLGMVLGDAHLYAGNRKISQNWYELCRQRSLSIGDRAGIGALMYNRAAFGLARLRIEYHGYGNAIDAWLVDFVEMELSSAWSFQIQTEVKTLPHLVTLCKARIAILKRNFEDAIQMLLPLESTLSSIEDRLNRSSVFFDLLYSYFSLGDFRKASELLESLDIQVIRDFDVDDQLLAYALMSEVTDKLGTSEIQTMVRDRLGSARTLYEIEQRQLRTILEDPLFANPPN